jgi:hypothetical protein
MKAEQRPQPAPDPAPIPSTKVPTTLQRAFYADASAAIRCCRREDLPLLWVMKAGFWRDSMTPELFEMLENFYSIRVGIHAVH